MALSAKTRCDGNFIDMDIKQRVHQLLASSPYALLQRRHKDKPTNHRGSLVKTAAVNVDIYRIAPQRDSSPYFPRFTRSRTMPSVVVRNSAKNYREHTQQTLDRLQKARELVERAVLQHKIFCIGGHYPALRKALRERGWVEKFCFAQSSTNWVSLNGQTSKDVIKPVMTIRNQLKSREINSDDDVDNYDDGYDDQHVPPWDEEDGLYGMMSRMLHSHLPNFVFTTKTSSIEFVLLEPDQIVNHYSKNSSMTTKTGLLANLRNLSCYELTDSNTFFPRCYKISNSDEKQEFINDFRVSACHATIKWLIDSRGSSDLNSEEACEGLSKIPCKMLDFAVGQCERFAARRCIGRDVYIPTDYQWDEFLSWYYELVHNRGRIENKTYSMTKLRFLAQRIEKMHPQFRMDGCKNIWILKPGAQSRGRGVRCYCILEEILKLVSKRQILDGSYVIQKYIERPLLIHSTKFDIRQWFLVTDWNPLTMWFYQDSYLRFCSQLFTLENFDQSIHLSNNSIQANYSNAKNRSHKLPPDNMWTSDAFKNYLAFDLEKPHVWNDMIYPGMKKAIILALKACQDTVLSRRNSFELYGADFMITEDFQPWLIEINSSPCLAPSTSVTSKMCPQVQEDLLKVIFDRKVSKKCDTGKFELAYSQPLRSFKDKSITFTKRFF